MAGPDTDRTDDPSAPAPSESTLRRVAVAALSASTLEWFDFYIYGTAAALVFNTVFFPDVDPTLGTLAAFATFGVGFVFRPIGGILFGHFGDRVGRRKLLVIAMMMMGVATTLIGLLPTYAAVGIAAPILLVVLRSVQGIAIGGQYGGALLLVTENAPPRKRGFYGSFAHIGPSAAVILSNVIFLVLVEAISPAAFASWGWRVPFLLSVVIIGLGLWIQVRLEDTAEFRALQDRAAQQAVDGAPSERPQRSPIIEAVRTHPRQVLQTAGMVLALQVYFYILIVFMLSYVTTELGVPRTTILTIILISTAVSVVSNPFFAAVSDRVGRRRVLLPASVATLLSAFPVFWLFETATIVGMTAGALLGGVVLGALYGPMAAFYTEMFSTEVRYSGASLGYQLGAVVGGGFAPLIAGSLLVATGTINSVAAYVAVAAAITVVAIATTAETHHPTPARSLDG